MRKNREIQDGAIYHVIARANRRELILDDAETKELFLTVVKVAKKKHEFSIKNFCVMGNHVHLIVQPKIGENLSKIMQWILSVFAIRFNRLHKLVGHVWYDRFESYILSCLRNFLKTFNYIADNPVKAGIVNQRDEFPWSGTSHIKHGMYDIVDPPDMITRIFFPEIVSQQLLST
jgi:putative transposase